jgi:hypothetical protein
MLAAAAPPIPCDILLVLKLAEVELLIAVLLFAFNMLDVFVEVLMFALAVGVLDGIEVLEAGLPMVAVAQKLVDQPIVSSCEFNQFRHLVRTKSLMMQVSSECLFVVLVRIASAIAY